MTASTWKPTGAGRSMTGAITFNLERKLDGKSGAGRKPACSRIPATAALRRSFGIRATPFAVRSIGRCGGLLTVAKDSPCRPWAPDTEHPRPAFARCRWELRTLAEMIDPLIH